MTGNNSSCVSRGKKRVASQLTQTQLKLEKSEDGQARVETWVYDQEKVIRAIAEMIIVHEYPLSMVEHEKFRHLMRVVQPLFKPISQNRIKNEIIKIRETERTRLKELLHCNKGRIAVSVDMWTAATHNQEYMAISAHYIDNDWKLQHQLLRFVYIPPAHTHYELCDPLVECLAFVWKIRFKLSTLTLENCSTNDCVVDNLSKILHRPSLMLDGQLFHLHCFAHVLNSMVKDGFDVIGSVIERVRDSVIFWTATPRIWKEFDDTCSKLFGTCGKMLVLDCPTKWTSTYMMLVKALPYKDVFSRLRNENSLHTNVPNDDDWSLASEICDKLKVYYKVTEIFPDTNYPTSNLFFSKICEIRLELYKWMTSSSEMGRSMTIKMLEKFEKYWVVSRDIIAIAAVLDPRYKFRLIEFFFSRIYGNQYMVEVDKIRELCVQLVDDYQSRNSSLRRQSCNTMTNQNASTSRALTATDRDVMDDFMDFVSNSNKRQSDLEIYLDDDLVPFTKSDFDILAWWKTNGFKYLVLCEIARDVLAIPVTSVASDSAFSTCGRVLESHHCQLHPDVVDILMCCQSWLRRDNQGNYSTFQDDQDDDDDTVLD